MCWRFCSIGDPLPYRRHPKRPVPLAEGVDRELSLDCSLSQI
jgi:hypothetical protein